MVERKKKEKRGKGGRKEERRECEGEKRGKYRKVSVAATEEGRQSGHLFSMCNIASCIFWHRRVEAAMT